MQDEANNSQRTKYWHQSMPKLISLWRMTSNDNDHNYKISQMSNIKNYRNGKAVATEFV